jgi:hypothetical protein
VKGRIELPVWVRKMLAFAAFAAAALAGASCAERSDAHAAWRTESSPSPVTIEATTRAAVMPAMRSID